MKKCLLATTLLFTLLIVAIVVSANTGVVPHVLARLYRFPGGDKAGHFFLFGVLGFLLNKSALVLFEGKGRARLVLIVSVCLSVLIGLEEWSQGLFPARTMALDDLLASYAGVIAFALLAYWSKP